MIANHNGLLVNEETNSALGYLFNFEGPGVFSPDGKVEIDKETAERHNACLAQAELAGLDHRCEIGQQGCFYLRDGKVWTWTGVLVSANVQITGRSITFRRTADNGHGWQIAKVYRGRLQKDADCFNFRRVK